MRSKNDIKNDLIAIRKELEQLKSKEKVIHELTTGKERANQTGSYLLELLKLVMESNKNLAYRVEQMQKSMEEALNTDFAEEPAQGANVMEEPVTKVVPISELDKKILQFMQLQHAGMACADDVKGNMNYRGRNAASARLNKLYKQGLVERFQLGHKVYYKYDAGKATKGIQVVSP